MITQDMVPELVGRQAYDRDGKRIGQIGRVYIDDRNGTPVWATVNTGVLGMKENFIPLASANVTARGLDLAVSKNEVKDAPRVADSDDHISPEEEGLLNRYYGRPGGHADGRPDGDPDGADQRSGRDAAQDMTRSEERLQVGTESVETGQVRLRKYVVTENQKVNVPVSHEQVHVEHEPIPPGQRTGGARIGEDEQKVTLHAERPVVGKHTEPVEIVRMTTETVTGEQTVSDTVRKEKVDVDDPQNQLGKHGQQRDRPSTGR